MWRLPAFLLIALLAACGGSAPKLNTGMAPPPFTTTTADGGSIRFPEDFKGKPVVIRFWADWCPYCEGEMRGIGKVYPALHARGLQVLAVNAGQDRDTVAAFAKRLGFGYPALLDKDSAIARSYGVTGLPTTFFVGADGVIKAKAVGETDQASFDRLAEELLQGKPNG